MIKEKGWNIIMSTNEIMPKLKDFLCENLGIDADVLEFDTQLFGDGEIGLDSIDSLEIIAYVDDEFGVQMTGVGKEHFYSIETIAKYIEENALYIKCGGCQMTFLAPVLVTDISCG